MHRFHSAAFTLVELVIWSTIIFVLLTGLVVAFRETFSVLGYINESMHGAYMARNGVEELVYMRNAYKDQYGENGWPEFASRFGSGYFRLTHDALGQPDLVSISNKISSYEGPLDSFGNVKSDTAGITFYRKIETSFDKNAFYLQNVARNATGRIDFTFSKSLLNDRFLLLSSPVTVSGSTSIEVDLSVAASYYSYDGVAKSSPYRLSQNVPTNRPAMVFRYPDAISDGQVFTVYRNGDAVPKTANGNVWKFEFDSNGSMADPSATRIAFASGWALDSAYFALCKRLSELDFLDCYDASILPENLEDKLFWAKERYAGTKFGSGFVHSVSGNVLSILSLGSWSTVQASKNVLKINPTYQIRSAAGIDFSKSVPDQTGGAWVSIPDLPASGVLTSSGIPSSLTAKVTVYLFDGDEFVEENALSVKLGDIYRLWF